MANRMDPNGDIPVIAEYLSQSNDYYQDMPFFEANEATGHEFVFRTSIPAGTWRQYNQGVPYSRSTTAKARVGLGMLTDYSQVDKSLAKHSGHPDRYRETEDAAFLEGMSQTIAQTVFYGNTISNPNEFMGFSAFYNTLNVANAQNAASVLNGLGTGSANLSIWLIGWGANTIFGLYPRGSKAGLSVEDQGDVVPGFDNAGNRFPAWTTYFEQEIGLCPKDWRYGVRLANVDTTTAGLAGPDAADLFILMGQMMMNFPKFTPMTSNVTKTDAELDDQSVHAVFYVNRTGRYWMDVQAMRDRNVLLMLDDFAGKPCMTFRGIKIAIVDQLSNNEATVT
jgi:hypothetical protein